MIHSTEEREMAVKLILLVPEREEPNVHVQAPLLLLEFEYQNHEEHVHQTETNESYILWY